MKSKHSEQTNSKRFARASQQTDETQRLLMEEMETKRQWEREKIALEERLKEEKAERARLIDKLEAESRLHMKRADRLINELVLKHIAE